MFIIFNMDPISASVNFLTLLNAAGSSSVFLYKFFKGLQKARREIQYHFFLLEGLSEIFSALYSLHVEPRIQRELPKDFLLRLESCSMDLQEVEAKVQNLCLCIKGGTINKSWAKIKWSLDSQDWLKGFFARVQGYHAEFSLKLHCVQL